MYELIAYAVLHNLRYLDNVGGIVEGVTRGGLSTPAVVGGATLSLSQEQRGLFVKLAKLRPAGRVDEYVEKLVRVELRCAIVCDTYVVM